MLETDERCETEKTDSSHDRTVHIVCGVCAVAAGGNPVKCVAFCGFDKLKAPVDSCKPRQKCVVCIDMAKTPCVRCGTQNF